MFSRANPAWSSASMAARAWSASAMVPTTRFVGYAMKFFRSMLTAFTAMTRGQLLVDTTAARSPCNAA